MKFSHYKDQHQGLKNWEDFYTGEIVQSLKDAVQLPFEFAAVRSDNFQAPLQADLEKLRNIHEQLIRQLSQCDPVVKPAAEIVLKAFAEKIELIEGFLRAE